MSEIIDTKSFKREWFENYVKNLPWLSNGSVVHVTEGSYGLTKAYIATSYIQEEDTLGIVLVKDFGER